MLFSIHDEIIWLAKRKGDDLNVKERSWLGLNANVVAIIWYISGRCTHASDIQESITV